MATQIAPPQNSDGDENMIPSETPVFRMISSGPYHDSILKRLATIYLGNGSRMKKGDVSFQALPSGYALFLKYRSDGAKSDMYIVGHRSGKFFDATVQFAEHLRFLFGDTTVCECKVCNQLNRQTRQERPQSGANNMPPAVNNAPCSYGTIGEVNLKFDYGAFARKAYEEKQADPGFAFEFQQPLVGIETFLADLNKPIPRDTYPRVGEVVLYSPKVEFKFHQVTGKIRLDLDQGKTLPPVFAGIVHQTGLKGIVLTRFFSNVHQSNCHVIQEAQQIPFAFFYEILKDVPEETWDSSIWYAVDALTTITTTPFAGYIPTPPSMKFYAPGLWIGSEYIALGDCVRIMESRSDFKMTAILHVGHVHLPYLDGVESTSFKSNPGIRLIGELYTLHPTRIGSKKVRSKDKDNLPGAIRDKGILYKVENEKGCLWSFDTRACLGRIHTTTEAFGPFPVELDGHAILAGREFGVDVAHALNDDAEIIGAAIKWSINDDRAAALGVPHINEFPKKQQDQKNLQQDASSSGSTDAQSGTGYGDASSGDKSSGIGTENTAGASGVDKEERGQKRQKLN